MRKNGSVYIIILICLILVILAAALLTGGTKSEVPQPTQDISARVTMPPVATPEITPPPQTVAPMPPPVTAPPPTEAVEPPAPSASIPKADAAEEGYFSDAVFIGNSLVDGLYLYGGIEGCDFLSATGVSIYNFSTQKISDKKGSEGTIMSFLEKKQYGKVYILLGINEIGGAVEAFIESYESVLAKIAELQPDAAIYILSLTPVSEEKSAGSEYFTKENVQKYNEAICAMCSDKGYNYIDCFTPLADENGFLPKDAASDGIHFNVSYYATWMDVIKANHI